MSSKLRAENRLDEKPMDIKEQKATQFVHRLLANPALQDQSPVQKEQQIRQFLKANGNQLYPTLSSNSFFPGYTWPQIQELLVRALGSVVDQTLSTQLKAALDKIDFGFISFLREQGLPVAKAPEALMEFQKNLLAKPEARQAIAGPLVAVQTQLPSRYIDQAFRRREYIYFELVKVQRLRMSKEEIKNLILASLLLKNSIHLLTVGHSGPQTVTGVVQKQFAEKVLQSLKGRPVTRVDRGAVSPDKSWFNISRRNFKFYGFDIKLLDELYKIAGENGW